jgi:hypothetical protein
MLAQRVGRVRSAVRPAAEADQRAGGPVHIPDPIEQPAEQPAPGRNARVLPKWKIDYSPARIPACTR